MDSAQVYLSYGGIDDYCLDLSLHELLVPLHGAIEDGDPVVRDQAFQTICFFATTSLWCPVWQIFHSIKVDK